LEGWRDQSFLSFSVYLPKVSRLASHLAMFPATLDQVSNSSSKREGIAPEPLEAPSTAAENHNKNKPSLNDKELLQHTK
jgi:hypothetical protein